MTNSRIFKIAHRSVRHYAAYNKHLTYAERFALELKKQFKFEREAKAEGTLAARIEIQNILIEGDATAQQRATSNMTFLQALTASQNKLKVASQKSENLIAA